MTLYIIKTTFLSFLQKNYHQQVSESIPQDAPPSTISGDSIPEKLQDIYNRNHLFQLHLEKVKNYQADFFGNPESIVKALSSLKEEVNNHFFRIRKVLELYLEDISLTTPAPLQSHSDDYARKEYGLGVIVSLRDWLKQVQPVVKEAQTANGCDQ